MRTVERLYESFQPKHYQLELDLSQPGDQFAGRVKISGDVSGANVKLHSKKLKLTQLKLNGQPADFQADVDDAVIIHAANFHGGPVEVEIEFEGHITKAMHGIYPCYFNHNGQRKQLLATQFESHHAREAFPCVDEPEAKATFDVSLITAADIQVLGNTPAEIQSPLENGRLETKFETTPVMSPYLLAFVVGEMHTKSGQTKRGIDVSIWATVAQPAESLDFALDMATKIIDFYEDYFGVDYPLKKCDHVALPDFESGAMENWGLITYREVALLTDPGNTSVSTRHFIASVIAHELAHQWFGNLVTMKWWNELWLNESFADFVEHIPLDAMHPEWETWLDFILTRGIAALRRDAMDGVQAVQVEVHHPDEINTLFDGAIVYGKGARLMKMLRSYIGDQAFRQGLKNYFTKFAYQNTTGQDLWDCLAEASGKDVAKFMNAWIMRPGYPVVSAAAEGLDQQQFFIGEHADSKALWPILLSAEPADGLPEILDERHLDAAVSQDQRFNIGDTSHFITRYTPEHLHHLLEQVASFETIDRLTLLNDQTLLVRGRYESSAVLIDLLRYYQDESNDAVWNIMSLTLGELKKFVETDEPTEKKLKQLAAQIAKSQFERLGVDEIAGESTTDSKLRPTILGLMLYGEDQTAIQAALEKFSLEGLPAIASEIRPLVISAMVKFGDDADIATKLMAVYHSTSSAELREDIAAGITATHDQATAKKLLSYCMDADMIRPQDVLPWFVYLLRNRHTRLLAWQWLRDNWTWVVVTYGGDKTYDEFPRFAASGLMTKDQLDQYKDFFTPMMSDPALKRSITLGISEIGARLALLDDDGPEVRQALLDL